MASQAAACPGRRLLQFDDFEQALGEVDRLLGCPHSRAGNWDLSQVCDHLAGAFDASMHGLRYRAPWLLRILLSRLILRRVLRTRRIPGRANIPKRFEPKAGQEAAACAARLREKVRE